MVTGWRRMRRRARVVDRAPRAQAVRPFVCIWHLRIGCSHYQVDYTCCLNNLKLKSINLDLSPAWAPTCRCWLIQACPCLTGSESTLGPIMSSLERLARPVPRCQGCCSAVHCHYRPVKWSFDSNRSRVLLGSNWIVSRCPVYCKWMH